MTWTLLLLVVPPWFITECWTMLRMARDGYLPQWFVGIQLYEPLHRIGNYFPSLSDRYVEYLPGLVAGPVIRASCEIATALFSGPDFGSSQPSSEGIRAHPIKNGAVAWNLPNWFRT